MRKGRNIATFAHQSDLIYRQDSMKQMKYVLLAACLGGSLSGWAQANDGAMTINDLAAWERIAQQAISDDGRWVACRMEPWEGDATVLLFASKGG